jgi:acyl carrier protein
MSADVVKNVGQVLVETLRLGARPELFESSTALLGGIPEFDSMAVVSVIAALEERFGIAFADDEIRGESFETVGALAALVQAKLDE